MMRRFVAAAVALGAVALGVIVGVGVAPSSAPDSTVQTVTVTPARQDVSCPGPLVTPGGGAGDDDELSGAPSGVTSATYTVGDNRRIGEGVASDGVVAAAVERVSAGDVAGLSALTCTAPLTDQWLVGANTTVGDSARLVLTNPSPAAVEATVTLFGTLGQLESERVVPIGPQDQAELLLEGVEVNVAALVVRVTSTGNGVTAAIQHSRLDGFQPAGTDWVVAGAGARDSLVVPGVGTGEADGAVVRLMAPEGATAHLALAAPEGAAEWDGVAALELEPGVAIEVPIPAIADGAVTITADAPVVAGVVVTRVRQSTIGVEGATAEELRWIPAQAPEESSARAILSVGFSQRISVYSATGGTFTLTDGAGATLATAHVDAGATASIPVTAAPGAMLSAEGAFAWTVLVADNAFITAMAPARTTIDDVEVAVRQQPYVPEP